MLNIQSRICIRTVLFCFCCINLVRAQSPQSSSGDTTARAGRRSIKLGSIAGFITNDQQWPLGGATISVMDQETGLFLKHALSDENGRFTLRGIPVGREIDLRISYTGFLDTSAVFVIKDTIKTLWTGTWVLRTLTKELEAVSVTRRKPPFVVKKDTLEFDAKQFKTLPNDVVKDLLRKLPGMVIDANGGVSMNGKPIDRIKVDGRDFMGGNLRSALDNLPGSIIDKVQVTDTRDPGEENTSVVRKRSKSLTLNLTLKKENKIGILGNAEAAAGSPERRWGKGFLNVMKKASRLTVEAAGSNVNKVDGGSTSTDGVSRGGLMSEGEGIMQRGLGVSANFNTKVNKTDADLVYSATGNRVRLEESTDRQVFLPDSGFFYRSFQSTDKDETGQNLRGGFDIPIDSLQRLRIGTGIGYTDRDILTNETARTLTPGMAPINSVDNIRRDLNRDRSFNNHISYELSSRNHKTNIRIFSMQRFSQTKGTQDVRSINRFYGNGDSVISPIRQSGNIFNKGFGSYSYFTLKQDLSKKIAALAQYYVDYNSDNNNKDVFALDSVTGHYIPDTNFTMHYRNHSLTHSPSLGIGYTGTRLTAEINAGMSFVHRTNRQTEKGQVLTINQKIISPTANLSYQYNQFTRQDASYNFRTEQPSPDQLVPIPDNSNPLVLRLGNPGLKTGANHTLSTGFNYNNPNSGIMLSSEVTGIMRRNSIVPDNFFDSLGRQVLSFGNVNGLYSYSVSASFAWTRMRSDWRLTLGTSGRFYYNMEKGFVNRAENSSRTRYWMPDMFVSMGFKEKIELYLYVSLMLSKVTYSLPGIAPTQYRKLASMGKLTYNIMEGMKLSTDLDYQYNSMIPAGFSPSSTIVSSRLDYSFLKGQRLTVYGMVNDVFNNSNPVSRTVSATEIRTSSSLFLRRCMMVGLRFRFDKFEARKAE